MIGRALTRHYRIALGLALLVGALVVGRVLPERQADSAPIVWYSSVIHVQSDPTSSGWPARIGTVAVLDGTSQVYVKTGTADTAWTRTDAGAAVGSWLQIYTDAMSSLTNWTQTQGVWTVTNGAIQSDSGTSEAYLSEKTTLGLAAPFDKLCQSSTNCLATNYAACVDVAFLGTATTSTDCGMDFRANTAVPGNGHVRVFIQKDGTKIGADVFGGSQFLWNAYPPGAFSTNTYYTLCAQWVTFLSTTQTVISIGVNGQAYAQGPLNVSFGGMSPTTLGAWANPSHCAFKNWRVYTYHTPV